ncbi:hypothetical protein [Methylobacterium brachythecii]|uniref:Uncharacterized protein n=1 Tax=Methylobacterium brachythecii TaxID=1176177 RepID=A0A7W6F8Q1_9HYPH|nr:hypothetical protein [Methylobacterium brachythecii]MBB3904747.1 hypothetical protein [Methylobacterium brachythecii]GLS45577.1 hypothetical protein GCM10007884_35680 [Methylobacterium brachythecii]
MPQNDECLMRTELEFAVADAAWLHELALNVGYPFDEEELQPAARKGEANSRLREAYEERRRALFAFRRARGVTALLGQAAPH